MIEKEYRIVLPMTVDEYRLGQLYSVAEESMNSTGGGEGIEVVKNEPFDNVPLFENYNQGQYTFKKYYLASKIPKIIRLVAPTGALVMHEEAWNAYPYCKTVITNPDYMGTKFKVTIESLHLADRGGLANVFKLAADRLKKREVVMIDIGKDKVGPSDYSEPTDPSKYHSTKTGRGPLKSNWTATFNPTMTCYKLVTVDFQWFGLQGRVEKYIHKSEQRLFTIFHRKVFCWIDAWHGMTIEDIRELEERVHKKLQSTMNVGEVRGIRPEDTD